MDEAVDFSCFPPFVTSPAVLNAFVISFHLMVSTFAGLDRVPESHVYKHMLNGAAAAEGHGDGQSQVSRTQATWPPSSATHPSGGHKSKASMP